MLIYILGLLGETSGQPWLRHGERNISAFRKILLTGVARGGWLVAIIRGPSEGGYRNLP